MVGIDSNEDFLDQARATFAPEVAAGRIELRQVDAEKEKLPFPDRHFDNIVCQNVLECISDKAALIDECHRVLKGSGVFLLGHHDFGAVMLNSSDAPLTRRIVAAYADETQDWMPVSDGEIGRKLPGIMRASKFVSTTTETRLQVDLDFEEGSDTGRYCQSACAAAQRAGVTVADLEGWIADLAALNRRGEFYFGIPWIYARATK